MRNASRLCITTITRTFRRAYRMAGLNYTRKVPTQATQKHELGGLTKQGLKKIPLSGGVSPYRQIWGILYLLHGRRYCQSIKTKVSKNVPI